MKKNGIGRQLLFYVIVFGIIIVMLSMLMPKNEASTRLERYDELYDLIRKNEPKTETVTDENGVTTEQTVAPDPSNMVKKIVLYYDNGMVEIRYTDNGKEVTKTYELASIDWFRDHFDQTIMEYGIDYVVHPATPVPIWVSFLPTILIIVLFVVLYFVSFKKMSGGGGKFNSFGKAKVKTANANDKSKVLFRDVAGADEDKFTKLGAKIPHGVLLVGPPGTGKTLLAKAVAGEAGVPFYSISGSDFVEMYVGVGASRVRDLFDTARKTPAAIIFIDEIDAVGRHRGAGLGGGHDEREQTLNQLLVEMDGFGSHDGIIVMAATNRPDILDPALLRPGRFDRQVTVNYPDMKGREEILKVHARNKPLEESVDFHKVAQSTVGFTGADLANLLNEAALLAAKKGKALIGMDDIEESFMKSLLGPQKNSKIRTEKENKLTAYHEAGHAVVSHYCKNTDPVKYITIIPAGNAGGVTVSVPEQDVSYTTRGDMIDVIKRALGGRIAEELIMDDISTGASSDIQQATKIARNMVTRYGMSDMLGTVLYGSEHSNDEVFLGRDFSSGKNYSEQTAAAIDREIQRIIGECYAEAKRILSEHIDKLHFVAQYLLKHECMDGDQFAAAMKDGATEEDLDAIAAQKAEKSRRDNEARAAREAEEKARREAEMRSQNAETVGESEFLQDAESDEAVEEDEESSDDTDEK